MSAPAPTRPFNSNEPYLLGFARHGERFLVLPNGVTHWLSKIQYNAHRNAGMPELLDDDDQGFLIAYHSARTSRGIVRTNVPDNRP